MLPESPLLTQYIDSFSQLVFRMLDMMRLAPEQKLKELLNNEVQFLYHLLALVRYQDPKHASVDALLQWANTLGSDIQLEQMRSMYTSTLERLGIEELAFGRNNFTFSTIWDSMHFLCLLCDDLVENRKEVGIEIVKSTVRNLKWVFYNFFIILFCPKCAKHFLTVNNFPYTLEQIEVALYRETQNEPIVFAHEINRSTSHKNVLLYNHALYNSMVFHNHINNYRPIQTSNDSLNNYQRMDWGLYKQLLNLQ